MSAMREKDNADFDLEAFIDLFDEALTSDDPAVQKTLQHLMVICALTRNHDGHSARSGPLRRVLDDQANILRRLERLETSNTTFGRPNTGWPGGGYNPHQHGTFGPVPNSTPTVYPNSSPGSVPIGGGGGGPAYPHPNPIWTTTTAASVSQAKDSAIAGQSGTGFNWTPEQAAKFAKRLNSGSLIAERVDDLLKDEKYKGSTVGAVDVKIS